jgi:RNA polymerase sigma factor (sigma-70 family)
MPDSDAGLQSILDRMNAGDADARREFLGRACDRLRRLAAAMLSGSFPALQARHEVDSIVHECWIRLVQALDRAATPTPADFFRLAAHKKRQVLLDAVGRQRCLDAREGAALGGDSAAAAAGGRTLDPQRLALWSEFHEQVARLPEDERQVFEMHYHLDLSQAEIAQVLGLHPPQGELPLGRGDGSARGRPRGHRRLVAR